METIRYIKPIRTDIGSDFRDTPMSLKNAKLYPSEPTVRGLMSDKSAAQLNPGRKPYFEWNNRFLSRGANGIVSGDTFNSKLYTTSEDVPEGLAVYPPNYGEGVIDVITGLVSGTYDKAVGPPRVVSITSVKTPPSGDSVERHSMDSWVGYIIIPFTAEGEAGVWTPYWVDPELYKRKISGKTAPYESAVELQMQTTNGAVYVEVYRTTVNVLSPSTRPTGLYYYMGRFEGATSGAPATVSVVDDKTWIDPKDYGILAKGTPDAETAGEFETLMSLGVYQAELVTIPSAVLDYSINVHGIQFNGDLDASSPTVNFLAPRNFYAGTMMLHSGRMLYGDVKWGKRHPLVVFATSSRQYVNGAYFPFETTGAGGNIFLQLEYETTTGVEYGPVLRMDNALRVVVKWQGEAACLVYDTAGLLMKRLIPDSNGLYMAGKATLKWWDFANSVNVLGTPLALNFTDLTVRSYLTYDQALVNVAGIDYLATEVGTHVHEENVILESALNRPLEVTFRQFYLPDDSRVRALTYARQAEEEGVATYDGYAFTDDSVFYWQRVGDGEYTVLYITPSFGIQSDSTVDAMVTMVRDGVVFVGTNGYLYGLTGRNLERIDSVINSLWSTIHDLAYNRFEHELAIATDTGVWYWDFEVFSGIYKQVDRQPIGNVNLQYITGVTIPGLYSGLLFFDDGDGDDGGGASYLLEKGLTPRGGTEVTTQWLRHSKRMMIRRIVADLGPGPFYRKFSIDSGVGTNEVNLLADPNSTQEFDEARDVGSEIRLPGAGVAGAPLTALITQYNGPTQVLVDVSASTTSSTHKCMWPLVNIDHSVRTPTVYTESFTSATGMPKFPRYKGEYHQFTIKDFLFLWGIEIETEEE